MIQFQSISLAYSAQICLPMCWLIIRLKINLRGWYGHIKNCYYGRTKRFGELLKVIILVLFPVPMVLWLPAATIGSVLTGLVFGIALPLMATFVAVREGVSNKLVRCLKVLRGSPVSLLSSFFFWCIISASSVYFIPFLGWRAGWYLEFHCSSMHCCSWFQGYVLPLLLLCNGWASWIHRWHTHGHQVRFLYPYFFSDFISYL